MLIFHFDDARAADSFRLSMRVSAFHDIAPDLIRLMLTRRCALMLMFDLCARCRRVRADARQRGGEDFKSPLLLIFRFRADARLSMLMSLPAMIILFAIIMSCRRGGAYI